ncbi:MAG: hypothetical protein H6970_15385 [Gammaproteobacteria bacterium]|nr:hypothetical protein [Gammaproteobacteria bacterium]
MTLPLKPEQLGTWVAHLPPSKTPLPEPPARSIAALRQQSTGTASDSLARPGGDAGEQAWRDHEAQARQPLKVRLATAKLHTGLIVAAISQVGTAPPETVPSFVERASRWLEDTTAQFAQGSPVRSNYHRYELARVLVNALERRPTLVDEIAPEQMGQWFAQEPPHLPTDAPAASAWQSLDPATEWRMAWARALTRVLEAAIQAPFNREPSALLDDAKAALTTEVERQSTQAEREEPALPEGALRIIRLHALKSASQLYAATLRQVYHESARAIQQYQDLIDQGKTAEADQCALDYQARHLGYVGVPHHFQENTALQERLATAAAAPASPTASDPSPTDTARASGLAPS